MVLTTNASWGDGTVKNFRSLTINPGVTLSISGKVTITVAGTLANYGTLNSAHAGSSGVPSSAALAADARYISVTITNVTYDALGRKTQLVDPDAGTWLYTYDGLGRLYTHAYDLEGRQTSVAVSGVSTEFIYNADGELVAKKVGGTARAHYASGGLYEKDPSTGAAKRYYRFAGRLVAVRDSATGLHYLHQDHVGSTSLQTTSTGAYEGHEFRGPFGQPLVSGGSLATDLKYTKGRSLRSAQRPSARGWANAARHSRRLTTTADDASAVLHGRTPPGYP